MKPKQDKYRLLVENLLDAFAYHRIITDSDGNPVDYILLDANTAYTKMTGLPLERISGKKVTEIFPGVKESAFDWISTYGKVALRGESIRFEQHFEPLDRWYEVTAYSDEPGFFSTVFRDITDRKQGDKVLRESKRLFSNLAESSPSMVARFNTDLQHTYCNAAVEHLLGIPADYLLGKSLLDLKVPGEMQEQLESMHQSLKECLETGVERKFEQSIALPEVHKYFLTRIVPERNERGIIESLLAVTRDITDRKQAEASLKASEERYSILVQNANEAIVVARDGWNVFCNPMAMEIFGRSESEILSAPFIEFIHHDDRDEVMSRHLRRMDREVAKERYSFRIVTGKGSIKWAEANATVIQWEGKNASLVLISDITEQKNAEKALKQEEQRYRELFEGSRDGFVKVDKDWKILDANHAFYNMLGYNIDELREMEDFLTLTPRRWWKWEKEEIWEKRLIQYGYSGIYEKEYIRKDGTIFPVEIQAFSVTEVEDSISYYWGVVRDITERKRMDELLSESEERFRYIAEFSPLPFLIVDNKGNYEYINPKFTEVFGYTLADIPTGKVWFELVFPDPHYRQQIIETWKQDNKDLDKNEVRPRTFTVTCKNGLEKEILFRPVLMDNGKHLTIYEDITERKQAAEALQKLNLELEQRVQERTAELEATNKELDAFCYSVSHDLRAPLRGIEGFSQALLEDYADSLDEQGRDYMIRVCESSRRMDELIEDLLILSSVTRLEISQEKVDLSSIASSCLARLQEQDPNRQVEIIVTPGITVMGDTSLLQIVLENLLDNAWKYTGKVENASIEFGITEEAGRLACYIKDSGAGFNMDYAEDLFKPFKRLHDSREYIGTGVGLSIVSRVIQRHGGEIRAQGAVGQGAVFYFTLPYLKHIK